MRPTVATMLCAAGFALTACESLPVELPGRGGGAATPAPVSQPATPAAQPDSQTGIAGAALCISSAFYLADGGLMSAEDADYFAEVWTNILDVIPAEPGARQTAVDDSYAAFRTLDGRGENLGLKGARGFYAEDGICADEAFQRQYISRWGDPALIDARLQGGQ
jgi:hypothetical protein